MLPNQNMPMPPPPTGGPPTGAPPPPGAQPSPTEAKEVIKSQLRQAYSELKALAASSGVEWSEIEAAGAAPAGAGPMGGPPPMMAG